MHRTRDFRRKVRAKQIKRKKKIRQQIDPLFVWYGYYDHDGQYSKGKIHCSCRMCRSSDYNGRHIKTKYEISSIIGMKEQLDDLVS